MDLRHVNHIWDRVIPRYFSVMFYVKQRYFCVSPRRAGATPCPWSRQSVARKKLSLAQALMEYLLSAAERG